MAEHIVVVSSDRDEASELVAAAAIMASPTARTEIVHLNFEVRPGADGVALERTVVRAAALAGGGREPPEAVPAAVALGTRADLLVIGPQGLELLREPAARARSLPFLAGCRRALFVARGRRLPAFSFARLLIAIDLAADAAWLTEALAQPGIGLQATVVHVCRPAAGPASAAHLTDRTALAEPAVEAARRLLRHHGFAVMSRVLETDGSVQRALLDSAEAYDVDLVVIGSRRRPALEALLDSRIAGYLARHGRRPLLVGAR